MKQRKITKYEGKSLFSKYIDCTEISYRTPSKKVMIDDAYKFEEILNNGISIQIYTSEGMIDNFRLKREANKMKKYILAINNKPLKNTVGEVISFDTFQEADDKRFQVYRNQPGLKIKIEEREARQ